MTRNKLFKMIIMMTILFTTDHLNYTYIFFSPGIKKRGGNLDLTRTQINSPSRQTNKIVDYSIFFFFLNESVELN